MTAVYLSRQARKDMRLVPTHIAEKARLWIQEVQAEGLSIVQMRPGWVDGAKKGRLQNVRAVRLSREYRLFYEMNQASPITIVVLEINHHEYKKIERRYR